MTTRVRTSDRAGFTDARSFIDDVARAISSVEINEARHYISVSDASMSTWIGYDTPVPFGVSYYSQGRNLAALLDLSIRHDTRMASGQDDVMLTLFAEFYQRGRGFSTEDLIGVVQPDHHELVRRLLRRYVTGVEVPPVRAVRARSVCSTRRWVRTSSSGSGAVARNGSWT
jgi:predicted metalloprotease with PDZ domain